MGPLRKDHSLYYPFSRVTFLRRNTLRKIGIQSQHDQGIAKALKQEMIYQMTSMTSQNPPHC